MPNRITTEVWKSRAHSVWGDRYDYSRVEYINAKTPVTVICPLHGEWKCNPDNHISKNRGCPECGGSKVKTTSSFIRDATAVHGSRYDYSEAEYVNSKTKVKIECPVHGAYWMSPDAHTNGKQGCPKCGDEFRGERQRLTEKDIQYRLSKNCEGWEATVTLVSGFYAGMNHKLEINCSKHGRQEPRFVTSLLSSPHPCKKCTIASKDTLYTNQQIRLIVDETFHGSYEILPFIYRGQQTVLHLICPVKGHGEFSAQYRSLRKSPGCPKCAYKASSNKRKRGLRDSFSASRDKRFEAWLEAAHEMHGDFFDYSKVDYKNQHTAITITCPIHGDFNQKPDVHLCSGCRKCADEELFGLYSERYFERHPERGTAAAKVYYLGFRHEQETWFKVGITINTIQQRFSVTSESSVNYEVLGELDTTLEDAWNIENDLQRSHGDFFRYAPKLEGSKYSSRDLRLGPSECFSDPISNELFQEIFGPVRS